MKNNNKEEETKLLALGLLGIGAVGLAFYFLTRKKGCESDADCPEGYTCVIQPGEKYGKCVEAYQKCETDEDCPPGLQCINGICQPPQVECKEGEHKCIGTDLYECRDGKWVLYQKNSTVCGGSEEPECNEGETKCEGYDYYVCYRGKWTLLEHNSKECGYQPTPECTPGETKCEGYDYYECWDGEWVLIETNSSKCGYECNPGETKCEGYDYYECIDGQWQLIEEHSQKCGYPYYPSPGIYSNAKIVSAEAYTDTLNKKHCLILYLKNRGEKDRICWGISLFDKNDNFIGDYNWYVWEIPPGAELGLRFTWEGAYPPEEYYFVISTHYTSSDGELLYEDEVAGYKFYAYRAGTGTLGTPCSEGCPEGTRCIRYLCKYDETACIIRGGSC